LQVAAANATLSQPEHWHLEVIANRKP